MRRTPEPCSHVKRLGLAPATVVDVGVAYGARALRRVPRRALPAGRPARGVRGGDRPDHRAAGTPSGCARRRGPSRGRSRSTSTARPRCHRRSASGRDTTTAGRRARSRSARIDDLVAERGLPAVPDQGRRRGRRAARARGRAARAGADRAGAARGQPVPVPARAAAAARRRGVHEGARVRDLRLLRRPRAPAGRRAGDDEHGVRARGRDLPPLARLRHRGSRRARCTRAGASSGHRRSIRVDGGDRPPVRDAAGARRGAAR